LSAIVDKPYLRS